MSADLPLIPDYTGTPPDCPFPDPHRALDEHYGLVAVGGDLHPDRILAAYKAGIFPWPMEGLPLGWYCPPFRMVFDTRQQPLGRRFRKSLEGLGWTVTADSAFDQVLVACASTPRKGQSGTWIGQNLIDAYRHLHQRGVAHSLEVWSDDDQLIGGLFGLFVGRIFCGDSMFSAVPGASKVAFAQLARFLAEQGVGLIDGQVPNDYLASLGGFEVPRDQFLAGIAQTTGTHELGTLAWTEQFGRRDLLVIR